MNDSPLQRPEAAPLGAVGPATPKVTADGAAPASDLGFELNTDASLVDQRWSDFDQRHERRFGLAIEHMKSRIRGRAYDNDAMKLRVGTGGFYVESQQFPAAFYGDTGKATVEFISENEAAALVWEAVAHYRSEEAFSLTTVYSGDEPADFFFGYRVNDWRRYEIGFLRTSVPLHLRVLFDAVDPVPLLGTTSGAVVYQRTRGGKHVVVRAPGRRQPLLTHASL